MCVRVGCYWLPFPRLIHTTTVWPLTLSMSLRLLSSSHSNVATAVIVRRAAMTSRAAAAATQFSLPKRLTLQSSFHLTLSRIVNIAQPPSIAPLSTSAASPSVVVLHCLRWRPVSPSLVPRLLLLLLLAVSMSVLLLLLLSPLHVSANRGQGELPTSPNTSSFVQTVWGGMPTATSVSPTGADGPFPSGVLSSSLGQHAFDVNTNNLFIVDTGSDRIRLWNTASRYSGNLATLMGSSNTAGCATANASTGAMGTFTKVQAAAVDPTGQYLYVLDPNCNAIWIALLSQSASGSWAATSRVYLTFTFCTSTA